MTWSDTSTPTTNWSGVTEPDSTHIEAVNGGYSLGLLITLTSPGDLVSVENWSKQTNPSTLYTQESQPSTDWSTPSQNSTLWS
jgi:hypothetical protein